MAREGITPKQMVFVDAYAGEAFFNATKAAEMAGYAHPNTQGPRLLVNVGVRAELRSRIEDAAMSANEVLARLTAIARGEVTDVLDEEGNFDLKQARRLKKTGLLKKLKTKRTSKRVDSFAEGDEEASETLETSLIYEEVEFEMYSAHEALRDLGKFHKLFVDKVEHSNPDGTGLLEPLARALDTGYGDTSDKTE